MFKGQGATRCQEALAPEMVTRQTSQGQISLEEEHGVLRGQGPGVKVVDLCSDEPAVSTQLGSRHLS